MSRGSWLKGRACSLLSRWLSSHLHQLVVHPATCAAAGSACHDALRADILPMLTTIHDAALHAGFRRGEWDINQKLDTKYLYQSHDASCVAGAHCPHPELWRHSANQCTARQRCCCPTKLHVSCWCVHAATRCVHVAVASLTADTTCTCHQETCTLRVVHAWVCAYKLAATEQQEQS